MEHDEKEVQNVGFDETAIGNLGVSRPWMITVVSYDTPRVPTRCSFPYTLPPVMKSLIFLANTKLSAKHNSFHHHYGIKCIVLDASISPHTHKHIGRSGEYIYLSFVFVIK